MEAYFFGILFTLFVHVCLVLTRVFESPNIFLITEGWYKIIPYIILWPIYWIVFIRSNLK
jgi:hypothetical protein